MKQIINNRLIIKFINENQNKEYDYIVNCVGLGALEFCDDTAMHPVRGQVMRVKAPWMNACIILEHEVTYILPLLVFLFISY